MSKKPHLFLCHSSNDKKFVRRLAEELNELSVDVWLDEWELAPGDSLHECIGAALESSAYIGIVLSPDSIESKWCRSELQAALAREMLLSRKLALPILRRRVSLPVFLADRLYLDFRTDRFRALAQLAALIHGITPKDLGAALRGKKLKSLSEVRKALESAGWSDLKDIERKDYERSDGF